MKSENKKIIKYFAVFLLLFSLSLCLFPQDQIKIDSLEKILNTATDTSKVNILNQLAKEYSRIDFEKTKAYATTAIEISKSLNYCQGKAESYSNLAIYALMTGDIDGGLITIDSALPFIDQLQNLTLKASALNFKGVAYFYKTDYKEALKYFEESLEIKKSLNDVKEIAKSLNNIGSIYHRMGYYGKAIEYYLQVLRIDEEQKDTISLSSDFLNIGEIYYEKNELSHAREYFYKCLATVKADKLLKANCLKNIGNVESLLGNIEKAMEFYFNSLSLYEELGNKEGISSANNNIGTCYQTLGKYPSSLQYFKKSLEMKKESGDEGSLAATIGNIGFVYLLQGEYATAVKFIENSIEIALKYRNLNVLRNSYDRLIIAYSKLKDDENLQKCFSLYKMYSDSIFSSENSRQIAEMQTIYETEKKEAQISLLEKDKEVSALESKRQKLFLILIAAGAMAITVIAFIIFRSLRITRKQKHIITLQKDEVTRQREEIAHKNKDLTDSINYAQRIQSAILTSEQYLNDMFLPQGQASSHFILYKPKDIVAGDFYWAYKTPDGIAIWVAADSTGHGVPGAFMSMIGNSLLNEIVVEKGIHEPDEILNRMRDGVIKALGQGGGDRKKDGMDAAICCWNKTNNKVSFSGANNSLWIIRKKSPSPALPKGKGVPPHKPGQDGKVLPPLGRDDLPTGQAGLGGVFEFTEIVPDSQPVGQHLIMNPFTKKEYQLQDGDSLYTFTDGYCDQFGGPKGKKFKYKPFRELLISIQDKPMPEQREILDKTIEEWKGGMEQIDDICVFGVRV